MSCDHQFCDCERALQSYGQLQRLLQTKKGFARWSRVKRPSTLLFVGLLVPDGAVGSYDIDSDV